MLHIIKRAYSEKISLDKNRKECYAYECPKEDNMSILSERVKTDYKRYITSYENTVKEKLVPLNTTGRSKAQIVADMESGTLSPYIVSDSLTSVQHNEQCKCLVCFNSYLDKVLKDSEASLPKKLEIVSNAEWVG